MKRIVYGMKGFLRSRWPEDSWLRKSLRLTRRRLVGSPGKPIGEVLSVLTNDDRSVTFVQIGSNDGVRADPLHPHIVAGRWRGVLVEPLEYLFERLKRNYADVSGLEFECCAVAADRGVKTFYYVEPTEESHIPVWYNQLGSLSRDKVLKSRRAIPDIEDRLVSTEVT